MENEFRELPLWGKITLIIFTIGILVVFLIYFTEIIFFVGLAGWIIPSLLFKGKL